MYANAPDTEEVPVEAPVILILVIAILMAAAIAWREFGSRG